MAGDDVAHRFVVHHTVLVEPAQVFGSGCRDAPDAGHDLVHARQMVRPLAVADGDIVELLFPGMGQGLEMPVILALQRQTRCLDVLGIGRRCSAPDGPWKTGRAQ